MAETPRDVALWPESALLEQLRAGNVRALEAIVEGYQGPLYRYAVGIVHAEDVASDVVQDVFVRLWTVRESVQIDGALRGYLFRAVRNAALNVRVSEAARARREEAAALGLVSEVENQTDALEQQEFTRAMQTIVAELPPRCREIFVLVREHGLSYPEVAQTLGVSLSTVKTQMGRAMATLAARLAPFLALTLAARW